MFLVTKKSIEMKCANLSQQYLLEDGYFAERCTELNSGWLLAMSEFILPTLNRLHTIGSQCIGGSPLLFLYLVLIV